GSRRRVARRAPGAVAARCRREGAHRAVHEADDHPCGARRPDAARPPGTVRAGRSAGRRREPHRRSRSPAPVRERSRHPDPPQDDPRGAELTDFESTPAVVGTDEAATPETGTSETAVTGTDLLRPHAEQQYAHELAALARLDDRP